MAICTNKCNEYFPAGDQEHAYRLAFWNAQQGQVALHILVAQLAAGQER